MVAYTCRDCGKEVSEEQVRLSGDAVLCPACHALTCQRIAEKEAAEKAALESVKKDYQQAQQIVRAISIPDPDILTSEIVERLGGIEGVANLYTAQVLEAAKRNPGSRTAIQSLKWVAEMVDKIAERQMARSRMANLTDAELEAIVKQLTDGLGTTAISSQASGRGALPSPDGRAGSVRADA